MFCSSNSSIVVKIAIVDWEDSPSLSPVCPFVRCCKGIHKFSPLSYYGPAHSYNFLLFYEEFFATLFLKKNVFYVLFLHFLLFLLFDFSSLSSTRENVNVARNRDVDSIRLQTIETYSIHLETIWNRQTIGDR